MWKFLRRAVEVVPREIAWVFITAIFIMVITGCCLFIVDFASGGVVPDVLSATAGSLAGGKLILTVVVGIASILLVFGLLITRVFSGKRNKP